MKKTKKVIRVQIVPSLFVEYKQIFLFDDKMVLTYIPPTKHSQKAKMMALIKEGDLISFDPNDSEEWCLAVGFKTEKGQYEWFEF